MRRPISSHICPRIMTIPVFHSVRQTREGRCRPAQSWNTQRKNSMRTYPGTLNLSKTIQPTKSSSNTICLIIKFTCLRCPFIKSCRLELQVRDSLRLDYSPLSIQARHLLPPHRYHSKFGTVLAMLPRNRCPLRKTLIRHVAVKIPGLVPLGMAPGVQKSVPISSQ